MRLACAVAMTRTSTRLKAWSPGLGVSGMRPAAPFSRWAAIEAGGVTPWRARMSIVSP